MEGNSEGKVVSSDKNNRNPKRRDTIEYGWTKAKISGKNNEDHRYGKLDQLERTKGTRKTWRLDTETRKDNRRTRWTRITKEERKSKQQGRQGGRIKRQDEVH